jgi:hypothetical protein
MKTYKVYRNLHKNCFSVLKYNPEKKGYRLHDHVHHAFLDNVEARVSEAGRQKVLREKQKNVHAFLLCDNYKKIESFYGHTYLNEVVYNPYKHDSFVVKSKPFKKANCVVLTIANQTPKAFLYGK